MQGRHAGAGYLSRAAWITIVVVVVVAAGGGVAYWRLGQRQTACSGSLALTVDVATEILPAVRETAAGWAADARGPNGECVSVTVVGAEPADVALAIATKAGVSLTGILPTDLSTPVPDVWVPDSSSWLLRVNAAAPALVPTQAPSVARSPVVIAVPQPLASQLGWPTADISWTTLLALISTIDTLKIGIVEPNRDATGLSGLLALGTAAAAQGDSAQDTTVAAMHALIAGRVSVTSDLLAEFPTSTDADAMASSLAAAPLSEQQVIAYNAANPAVPLVALYVSPSPAPLDYPFAVLPAAGSEKAALAEQLRTALRGTSYSDRLGELGLRDPDGSGRGRTFPVLPGAPTTVAAAPMDAGLVTSTLQQWSSITKPGRMLAVIDVSGSMATVVADGSGKTREDIAKDASLRGISFFDDTWSVGLWSFSTNLDGAKDYRQILPIAPMPTQRPLIPGALDQVNPTNGGGTGLYDTVLAAYQTVQAGWDPVAVNSVVILTDGQNEDANGLNLDQLLAQLTSLKDESRPIQVIMIGIGDDVSKPTMDQITAVTGGGAFVAQNADEIWEIFLQAVGLRTTMS